MKRERIAPVLRIALDGLPGATMRLGGAEDAPSRSLRTVVPADAVKETRIFVTWPAAERGETGAFRFVVGDLFDAAETTYDATFFTE